MVKRAYDEIYVTSARRILSFALMSAVENYGVAVTEWLDGFISSGIAAHFGRGNPVYLSGTSGLELCAKVLSFMRGEYVSPKPTPFFPPYTEEFWAGGVLAYYQWCCGRGFAEIREYLPVDKIVSLYCSLHEADDRAAVRVFEEFANKRG